MKIVKVFMSIFSLIVLVSADILLIDRFFFYDQLLVVEPSFFKRVTGQELSDSGILANLVVSAYNGFIKSISLWPKAFLIFGILLLTTCILYEVYVYLEKLEKNKYYFSIKILANSISFTIIVFYYNLLIVKSTKISNDIVANFVLFKVILKKDVIEKKKLFFDTMTELVDKNEKLIPRDKEYLHYKLTADRNYEWLTDEYVDACSTKSLYETACKLAHKGINEITSTYFTEINPDIVNGIGLGSKLLVFCQSVGGFCVQNAAGILVIVVFSGISFALFKGYLNNHIAVQKLFGLGNKI